MFRGKAPLYNNTHVIDVVSKSGINTEKSIVVQVFDCNNILEVKLRDGNDYSFNYTARIDWASFEKIKLEQSLEIPYEEFKMQIIELLKQSLGKEMLIKIEADEFRCRIIFYEKSRIKSLIFLTIDFELTNQREIIDEMAMNLMQLKEVNKNLNLQISKSRTDLNEKEMCIKQAKQQNFNLEKQFCQNLKFIEQSFLKSISTVEQKLSEQLQRINLRHLKLICDLERVKADNKLKGESSNRLLQSLQSMRNENEKFHQTIRNLQMELDNMNMQRNKSDKNCMELRQMLNRKDDEIISLQKEVVEIRRDMTDATVIIAQKTKTHDELAKDLVQANTMIVNFNNHIDMLSEELEKIKANEDAKDKLISEQENELQRISDDFARYQQECKIEDLRSLKHELLMSEQKIEELEKRNREAARLNCILTKKLAQGDVFEQRGMSWNTPSNNNLH